MGILQELLATIDQGGWVMPPLVVFTLVLWFAIGYRASLLKRGSRRSVRELIRRAETGRLLLGKGLVDTAVLRGLALRKRGVADLRRWLTDDLADTRMAIKRYRVTITAIVAAAPLLGLLGTVTGMIETFKSLGDLSLFAQSGGIAGGISQALFTTQLGLVVAIPGLIVKGILDKRQQGIELELNQLTDILCGEQAEIRT